MQRPLAKRNVTVERQYSVKRLINHTDQLLGKAADAYLN